MKVFFVLLMFAFLSGCSVLQTPQDRIVARDTALAMGAVTAIGVKEWKWFNKSPRVLKEGWFGKDTYAGGADKTGHAYFSYLLTEVLADDFRKHNVTNAEDKAALAAFSTMALIELGDATGKNTGFSYEDLVANAAGVSLSNWLLKNPKWDKRIDVRMEYWPSPGAPGFAGGIADDYSGAKHLVALKGSGFQRFKGTPLEFLELQAGYYTRGFRARYDKGHFDTPERHAYVGLGLNLPRLFENKAPKVSKFLEYYQPPNTYLEAKHTF